MAVINRRTLLTGTAAGGFVLLAGCSPADTDATAPPPTDPAVDEPTATGQTSPGPAPEPEPEPEFAVTAPTADTVVGLDAAGVLALSRALFQRAGTVVVVGDVETAPASPEPTDSPAPTEVPDVAAPMKAPLAVARELGVPLFVEHPELAAELDRLGTHTVISFGTGSFGSRDVINGSTSELPELPGLPVTPEPAATAAYIDTADVPPHIEATLAAAGITPLLAVSGHPGETGESTALAKERSGPAVGVGAAFRDDATLTSRLQVTRTVAELPGGGVTPFPGRRMIALYGHPGAPVLGMMGEQSPEATVERVNKLVAEYQAAAPDENFIGAFEIITTIASASAGSDGNYSILSSFERVLPFIEAAEANDIYVVLDLQPGRSTFLEQAVRYEELLKRPWVGLAIDPEWRLLRPESRHMRQIGQVGIDEVNEVGNWLADLVRDNNLPPKVLTLHQFQPRMIMERERLDTSRDEIQYMVHVDGLGGQAAKQSTWGVIRRDLPAGVYLGWKNFEDEDLPMLTPQQTMDQVSPTPDFISYQ